jgi:hypothetical protein
MECGVLEYWSIGVLECEGPILITPLLHPSITESRRGTVGAIAGNGFRKSGRRVAFFRETTWLPGLASGVARYRSRAPCNRLPQ